MELFKMRKARCFFKSFFFIIFIFLTLTMRFVMLDSIFFFRMSVTRHQLRVYNPRKYLRKFKWSKNSNVLFLPCLNGRLFWEKFNCMFSSQLCLSKEFKIRRKYARAGPQDLFYAADCHKEKNLILSYCILRSIMALWAFRHSFSLQMIWCNVVFPVIFQAERHLLSKYQWFRFQFLWKTHQNFEFLLRHRHIDRYQTFSMQNHDAVLCYDSFLHNRMPSFFYPTFVELKIFTSCIFLPFQNHWTPQPISSIWIIKFL